MNIEQRDAHLSQFFSDEVMADLDEAQKTVLYEEFANSELRLLATQPIETIKSQTDRKNSAEIERRLSHIQPEEYPLLKEWYLSISKSVHEIICSKCGELLGIEVDTLDDNVNIHHHEGKFVVSIGDKMYAYRPRMDGVMGYQCANNVETKYKPEWDKFIPALEEATKKQELAQEQFDNDRIKYMALSPKKRAKETEPILDKVEFPEEPAGPPYEPCGNDTRIAQIEVDTVSQEHLMTSTTKDDIVKVKQEMNATNYEPDIKKTKRGYKVESFELREVKS